MSEVKEKIRGSTDIISLETIEKIYNQMKSKCICKVYGEMIGTGFFCKILDNKEYIPVLMTNYHVISREFIKNNNQLKISFNDEQIIDTLEINENNIIYSSTTVKYDIMILKIKNNNNYNYLELDDDLFKDNCEELYEKNSIYILHYPTEDKISVSFGFCIKNFDNNYNIKHFCNVKQSSSGCPILNLSTNKVIGIHECSNLNLNNRNIYNKGTLLKYPLKEMKRNEIKMEIKINKEDINKTIYFLDNTKKHRYLNDLNESNPELYINNIKYKYNKYFIPKKEGIYSIRLNFNSSGNDFRFMFAYCNNLVSIDLSSFNIKNATNCNGMFIECNNLKNINLPPLKIKPLFEGCNKIILKNISFENSDGITKINENIISMILNGFIQDIKTKDIFGKEQKNILNEKFKDIYEIYFESFFLDDIKIKNNLNLVMIIDRYFGNEDIFSIFLSSVDNFREDNPSILNFENFEKYLKFIEKLFDIYKEKKIEILFHFISLLKNFQSEKIKEEDENIIKLIFKLLYELSIKYNFILKALIKENIINILLEMITNYNKQTREIIYNIILNIIKNLTCYNRNNFELNEFEKEGKIYLSVTTNIFTIKKEEIFQIIFKEKPDLLKLIIVIMIIINNDDDLVIKLIDMLFNNNKNESENLYILVDIISILLQINNKNTFERYIKLGGYPNLLIKPISKENNNNQKWPLFGEKLINGDINQEIYEYIIADHNKNNRCLLRILFPNKNNLDNIININEEQKIKILLSFIKCMFDVRNNYPLFKYLYTMPSRSLKYTNLYEEIISYLDIYNMPNPPINLELMKNKEIKYKFQVEVEIKNNNKNIFEKTEINNEDNNEDSKNSSFYRYEDENIRKFNGFISEIIPGEIIREEIFRIAKNDELAIYRIHYFTEYYHLDDLREKLLNKKDYKNIEEKQEIKIISKVEETEAKKYDISEISENSIICDINDIDAYIIEDKTLKLKRNMKNTLIRFIFTNKRQENLYFNAKIKISENIKNKDQLIGFIPEKIYDYVKENDIKNFLNLQNLREETDFMELFIREMRNGTLFLKDHIIINLSLGNK